MCTRYKNSAKGKMHCKSTNTILYSIQPQADITIIGLKSIHTGTLLVHIHACYISCINIEETYLHQVLKAIQNTHTHTHTQELHAKHTYVVCLYLHCENLPLFSSTYSTLTSSCLPSAQLMFIHHLLCKGVASQNNSLYVLPWLV